MSVKPILEYDARRILRTQLEAHNERGCGEVLRLDFSMSNESCADVFNEAQQKCSWLQSGKVVVKVDQLVKRRGKHGLVLVNATWEEAKRWMVERVGKEIEIDGVRGVLHRFIVCPHVDHKSGTEVYLAFVAGRTHDVVLMDKHGGVDVSSDIESSAERLEIGTDEALTLGDAQKFAARVVDSGDVDCVARFLVVVFEIFARLHFTLLEMNPVVITNGCVNVLDVAARIDQTAAFEAGTAWQLETEGAVAVGAPGMLAKREKTCGELFLTPFGVGPSEEDRRVADLDATTGASLKLTMLNRNGRIWSIVAGGGASVAFCDAIYEANAMHELANYGEYSGAPSESQTYQYACVLFSALALAKPSEGGKVLFVGGGIANFTNVATTFRGICGAMREHEVMLRRQQVYVYVRRGGPNCAEGLRLMAETCSRIKLQCAIYGGETSLTDIVGLALHNTPVAVYRSCMDCKSVASEDFPDTLTRHEQEFFGQDLLNPESILCSVRGLSSNCGIPAEDTLSRRVPQTPGMLAASHAAPSRAVASRPPPPSSMFSENQRAFIFGLQTTAAQNMLDFDYISSRPAPSVAAIIDPFASSNHQITLYWGHSEMFIPVFARIQDAAAVFQDVQLVVSFASCRSVLSTTMTMLTLTPQIRSIFIVAEGVPERHARRLLRVSRQMQPPPVLVGAATVGAVAPGIFRAGNMGGMVDNVINCRLYRPGSVSYVARSGGISNELNSMIAAVADGVCEGVSIGGDRCCLSGFLEHIMRFERDPRCSLIVVLGEVGGRLELEVAEAICNGTITKPVIAYCIGVCAKAMRSGIQFGHAGASASSESESAGSKNAALARAGAIVPRRFTDMAQTIGVVFRRLVLLGRANFQPVGEPRSVPVDYNWAVECGLVRRPAHIVSTICDERGDELQYGGVPVSTVIDENYGLGGVVGLLWFRRILPPYARTYIEKILMLTADHGPAVAGAHNTIVTARAGKDLVTSLISGLATIGDLFGGALDAAAVQFNSALISGLTPQQFVDDMRAKHQRIMGIGHRVKSRTNPDKRVKILIEFVRQNFRHTPVLDYALQVEQITLTKKDSLILNVDGAIAATFVDLLQHTSLFTSEEATEYLQIGCLNGLFVVARSIGFIGHFIDQKRLKQGLYRHPWDDITYVTAKDQKQ